METARSRRDLDEWFAELGRRHPEMVGPPASERPRSARGHWQPVLLRVYGLRPWEMGRLTVGELRALDDDLEALRRG